MAVLIVAPGDQHLELDEHALAGYSAQYSLVNPMRPR
jgi:hypothetical protein